MNKLKHCYRQQIKVVITAMETNKNNAKSAHSDDVKLIYMKNYRWWQERFAQLVERSHGLFGTKEVSRMIGDSKKKLGIN